MSCHQRWSHFQHHRICSSSAEDIRQAGYYIPQPPPLRGWSLAWIGYVEGSTVAQEQSVLDGIYNIATAVPAILYIIVGLCLLFIYPLSKKKVNENIAILKARKGETNA